MTIQADVLSWGEFTVVLHFWLPLWNWYKYSLSVATLFINGFKCIEIWCWKCKPCLALVCRETIVKPARSQQQVLPKLRSTPYTSMKTDRKSNQQFQFCTCQVLKCEPWLGSDELMPHQQQYEGRWQEVAWLLLIQGGDGDHRWALGRGSRQRRASGAKGPFRSTHPHITEMLLQLQRNQQWLLESHPLSLFAQVVATNLASCSSSSWERKRKREREQKCRLRQQCGLWLPPLWC